MEILNEADALNSEEILELNKEEAVIEDIPHIIPVKYTRPPAFQKSGNIGKGNFKSVSNNRQRPGRAAGRGR